MVNKIDFVILWVDGDDPSWLKQKNEYSPIKKDYGNNNNRFRDWNNLRYWFRAVEKFAPWVNNVFFITWGHLPKWLNINHPKLKIIKHSDYIPAEYLPTFNSDVIETNLHRIKELSENFVLFNDDVFIIKPTVPEDFFIEGLPCDSYVENLIVPSANGSRICHTKLTNTQIINDHFTKKKVHRAYHRKVYNIKYGLQNFITLYFSIFPKYTGFRNPHIAMSHLKSTFETIWGEEYDLMHASCLNKFRGYNDISHWLMRYWNLCSGHFEPRSTKFGRYFAVSNNNQQIISYIKCGGGKIVCINDPIDDFDFDKAKAEINAALNEILPQKCSFEF